MIVVDIFILLFALAVVVVGAPIVVRKILRSDPKRKEIEAAHDLDDLGETNTVRHNLTELRRCAACHKLTDATKDLRVAASWIHQDCYLNEVQPKIEQLTKKDKNNA